MCCGGFVCKCRNFSTTATELIVIATYQEPVPGWIDNFYGPTGVIAGAGTGVLRTLRADPTKVANMVPVDLCVNGIISSAWDIAERFRTEILPDPEIPIYNFCTEPNNCITWGDFTHTTIKFGSMYPTMKAIWYLCYASNPNIVLHYLSIIFLHYAPAVVCDIIAVLIGRKPRLLRSYKKIHRFMDVIEYFSMREWQFKMDNMNGLWRKLSTADQKLFFFDMRQINWDYFLEQYFCGIRRYLLNDPMETVPQAVVRWNRLYWVHQATKVIVLLLLYKLIMSVWGMLS
uniref:Fatty acyl-CoA reductase n=1 Tax=Anopheles epiroticus TaxID=199890 RepID=A0A182P6X6_9DIPT